jgi:hypothetical protein
VSRITSFDGIKKFYSILTSFFITDFEFCLWFCCSIPKHSTAVKLKETCKLMLQKKYLLICKTLKVLALANFLFFIYLFCYNFCITFQLNTRLQWLQEILKGAQVQSTCNTIAAPLEMLPRHRQYRSIAMTSTASLHTFFDIDWKVSLVFVDRFWSKIAFWKSFK